LTACTRSQSGVTLIEVLISALMVSVIAIGTFTAFDTAGRASQDQRTHAVAGQLAQADEEHLRQLTQSELTTLTNTALVAQPEAENGQCLKEISAGKWEYTATAIQGAYSPCSATSFAGEKYTGTVFLVTTTARFVSASTNSLACETAGTTTDYVQTTSSVRWASLPSTRPPVTQSSIVNDSVTALLVKVFNQNHEPESGATVAVTGTSPTFSSSQTTPPAGCVIVTGITNSSVKVAVSKLNYVDRAGKVPPVNEQTVAITAGKSATVEFIIGKLGEIEAEFVTENSVTKTLEKAESDTFFARQGSITPPPLNYVQGTDGTYKEKETLTPVFPFALPAAPHEPEAYSVYAGDCEENNPHTVNAAVALTAANEALVKPGGLAKVTLEVPTLKVKLWLAATKAEAESKKEPLTTAESAEIVNSTCPAVPSAQNQSTLTNKHKVTVTATGTIKPTYAPYAKTLTLCVVAEIGAGKWYKFLGAIKNETKAGTALEVYMKAAEVKPEHEKSTTKGTLTCP
jgi:Tfp pilus assembly protein PilE